jgi:hypothetical protein
MMKLIPVIVLSAGLMACSRPAPAPCHHPQTISQPAYNTERGFLVRDPDGFVHHVTVVQLHPAHVDVVCLDENHRVQ